MLTNEQIVECNRKYWNDIIEMGRKHNIDPWKLVTVIDDSGVIIKLDNHPDFSSATYDIHTVKFAEFVLEGTPVFKGDKVYFRNDVNEFEILFSPVSYRDMKKRLSGDYVYHNIGEQVEIVCVLYSNPIVVNIVRHDKITGNSYNDSCYITQLTWNPPQKLPEKVQFIKDDTIILIQILNHCEKILKYEYGINDITRIKNKLEESIKDLS